MKKMFALMLIVFLFVACLASCDHKHIKGEWECDESGHWQPITCNLNACNLEETPVYDHIDDDEDGYCDICNYFYYADCELPEVIHLSDHVDWIKTLTAEDVAKVRTIRGKAGIAPTILNLKSIESSTDKKAISYIIGAYCNVEMLPISREEAPIYGGSGFTVEFVLNDGTVKSLYCINGIYSDSTSSDLQYFELLSVPTFREDDKTWTSYGFVSYGDMVTVCSYEPAMSFYNPEPICQIPLDKLEFEYDVDVDLAEIEPYNILVQTEFGDLTFITPDIFYTKDGTCCLLVGKDLDELISEYSESNDEYYVTMNDKEWLYEDLSPTYKAGDVVSVKIGMAFDIGYLFLVNGEEIATCKDGDGLYWEFSFIMPESDVVIDFKTYDGFLPDINYAVLIEAFWKKNLDSEYVSIRKYYGEFESGAIVAVIDSGVYTDVLWQETIDKVVIRYTDGNRIIVLYNDEFYTLTEAYNEGYITAEDLTVIADLHNY